MSLNSPSKIFYTDVLDYNNQIGYGVRFVQMGRAIRYSNMEKNMAMKPLPILYPDVKSVSYLGLVHDDILMDYPYVPPSSSGSVLSKLPSEIVSSIKESFVEYRRRMPFSTEYAEGKHTVVLVYKIRRGDL